MAERLGIGIIPGVGWNAAEVQEVAREAENAGFDAIFAAEVNNDVMATAQLMGTATKRIGVGTWIANIYLRHPYVCAQGAAMIADATGGRFILGLGVSHPPVNRALGIDMGDPPAILRRYVTEVRNWLKGEGPPTHLPQRPSPTSVPVYVAAATSRTVELAGELADGIMPFLWSATRIKQAKKWVDSGRSKASGLSKCDITLGIPTFLGDDVNALRETARQNLGLYTTFRIFSGCFEPAALKMRLPRWRVAPEALPLAIGCWMPYVFWVPYHDAGSNWRRIEALVWNYRSWCLRSEQSQRTP
jgi:alkanesulfonate monooxygenase SsuD/methylene tetrahydromethanopterin reductase-like flavin-dependent oxidoreductase (luciferase family)